MEVGLSPGDFVLDGDAPPLPKKGRSPRTFAHVFSGQTAAWIKMPLGTELGLGLRDIVLDGEPAPPPLEGHNRQFSANVRCGWTIKIPLGNVGLSPGISVFDGDPATPRKRHIHRHPIFDPCLLWRKGWMDQHVTWYEGERRPRRRCVKYTDMLCCYVRWGCSSS